MPAAAVASLTPAIAGISGTLVGASGETADDMASPAENIIVGAGQSASASAQDPAIHVLATSSDPKTEMAGTSPAMTS